MSWVAPLNKLAVVTALRVCLPGTKHPVAPQTTKLRRAEARAGAAAARTVFAPNPCTSPSYPKWKSQ